MTTKRRPTETIKAQREDIDQTMREFHAAADAIKYRAELSDVGRADARRSLTAQYKEHLAADAASAWKIATASVEAARREYQRAHAAHNENIDSMRLAWYAREYSAKLNAAAYTGAGVGSFDVIGWLGAQRDALAAANDTTGMRALRVVARENLSRALDGQSAGRLALVLQADEDSEAADVLAAQRELQAAENAAADLRRRIETHRATLDPHATDGLAGSDAFSAQVFGDAPAPNVLMSS